MTTPTRRTESAVEFLTLCASGKVREAYDRFVADGFRHHNPWFRSDRDSLLEAMDRAPAASRTSRSRFARLSSPPIAWQFSLTSSARKPVDSTRSSTFFASTARRSRRCGTSLRRFQRARRTSSACSRFRSRAGDRADSHLRRRTDIGAAAGDRLPNGTSSTT